LREQNNHDILKEINNAITGSILEVFFFIAKNGRYFSFSNRNGELRNNNRLKQNSKKKRGENK